MELLERKRKVTVSPELETNAFTIKASPKAFRILSSGLYSDKIKAIIRELSTNAYDAHVVNGNKKPFEVHLPTNDEPNFYIRDYGPGIAPEDILSIYTKYFESNKTGSNDLVGCLGLGSKSPFSYVNDFVVVSVYNGVKYTYSAFIGANEYPSITKLGEEQTNEPSGLKVEFLVKSQDISNFIMKAKEVYRYFALLPKFIGFQLNVERHEQDKNLPSGPDWYFCKENTKALAIMGNVAYPITMTDANLNDAQIQLLNSPICINFKIGDVDIEASREGLGYDNRTILHIKLKLQSIIDKLKADVVSEIDACVCEWDAMVYRHSVISRLNKAIGNIIDNVTYKGKQLSSQKYLQQTGGWNLSYSLFQKKYSWSSDQVTRSDHFSYLYPNSNMKFYVSDIKRGSIERVKQYVKSELANNRETTVLLVQPNDTYPTEFAALCDKIGVPKDRFINTSTLPAVAKSTPTRTGIKGDTDTVLKFTYNSYAAKSWVGFDHTKLPQDAVYIPISNWAGVDKDGKKVIDHEKMKSLIDAIKLLTGKTIDVYGVRARKEEWLVETYDVVHLFDYIKKMKSLCDVPELVSIASLKYRLQTFSECQTTKMFKKFNFPTKYKNFVNLLDSVQTKYYNNKSIDSQALQNAWRLVESYKQNPPVDFYSITIPESKSNAVKDLLQQFTKVETEFNTLNTPLLQLVVAHCDRYVYGGNKDYKELKELLTYLS